MSMRVRTRPKRPVSWRLGRRPVGEGLVPSRSSSSRRRVVWGAGCHPGGCLGWGAGIPAPLAIPRGDDGLDVRCFRIPAPLPPARGDDDRACRGGARPLSPGGRKARPYGADPPPASCFRIPAPLPPARGDDDGACRGGACPLPRSRVKPAPTGYDSLTANNQSPWQLRKPAAP